MKGFILKSETEIVAVIGLEGDGEHLKSDFWDRLRLAVAEHYCLGVEHIIMDLTEEQYEQPIQSIDFTLDTFEETEWSDRPYKLIETVIY